MSARRRSGAANPVPVGVTSPLRSPPEIASPEPTPSTNESTKRDEKSASTRNGAATDGVAQETKHELSSSSPPSKGGKRNGKRKHEDEFDRDQRNGNEKKKNQPSSPSPAPSSPSVSKSTPAVPAGDADSDGDIEMGNGEDRAPINNSTLSTDPKDDSNNNHGYEDDEERKSHGDMPDSSNGALHASSDDDDDDEFDVRRDFYQPVESSDPELVDPHDPFSSSEHRCNVMVHQLSPLFLPSRMIGLESQQKELHELLLRTMNSSVNNAALVLGPRGSGCSALVEVCLRDLKQQFMRQGKSFVEVRLNGTIQTDDTLAMRSEQTMTAKEELWNIKSIPGVDHMRI